MTITSAEQLQLKKLEEYEHQLAAYSVRVENDALRMAALKKDAERYRWLREKDVVDWDRLSLLWPKGFDYPDDVLHSLPMMLDASIDTAMGDSDE